MLEDVLQVVDSDAHLGQTTTLEEREREHFLGKSEWMSLERTSSLVLKSQYISLIGYSID